MLLAFAFLAAASTNLYDLVIHHAHVIDGTGSPWYSADIAVQNGRIAAIGDIPENAASKNIDAHGMVAAPGFIDMLGQSEETILVDPHLPSKIYQGITTEVTGEGNTIAPLIGPAKADVESDLHHFGLKPDWTTFAQYFARLEQQGIGINVADYVGATTVRKAVIGNADRPGSDRELHRMRELVRQAMLDGAVGVSSSLQYAPAMYANTAELTALASEAARFGGVYATHMRSEGDAIGAALDETFQIARNAHIPVEIWHLKSAGKQNWGRMPEIVAKIEDARKSGVDVEADTYAYTAWFNSFSAFVPPWAHDGGDDKMVARLKDPAARAKIRSDIEHKRAGWDNEWLEITGPDAILIGVVSNPELKQYQGKTVAEVAQIEHKDPLDTLLDLLAKDPSISVAVFGMSPDDVKLALRQPWVSVDNDSQGTATTGVLAGAHPHPRAYATFPHILRQYVREEHVLSLPDAIRKFSALPAQRMHFADRGVLKQGMWADIVVFDPDKVRDLATFASPNQLSTGMEYVLVNGVPVIAQGRMTNALPGKVLRGAQAVCPTGCTQHRSQQ